MMTKKMQRNSYQRSLVPPCPSGSFTWRLCSSVQGSIFYGSSQVDITTTITTNIITTPAPISPHHQNHHRLIHTTTIGIITTIPIIITTIMTIVIITIVIITPTTSLDCQRVEFQLPTIDLTSSPRRPRWR